MGEQLIDILIKILNNKDKKCLEFLFFLVIGLLIFISPGFLYMYLYERARFLTGNLIITCLFILIIDTLVFTILFILVDAQNVKFIDGDIKYESEDKVLYRILNTEKSLIVISLVITLVYLGPYFLHKDNKARITLICIGAILIFLLGKYIYTLHKVNAAIRKLEKEVNEMKSRIDR